MYLIISTLIAIAALPYWLHKRKRLYYFIETSTSLVSIHHGAGIDLSVTYKDVKASNIRVLIIKVLCGGNTPILVDDFNTPILFSFDKEVKIISSEIISSKPKNLTPEFSIEKGVKNKIELKPILFNPKDEIVFKFLLDGGEGNINVIARIAGVKEITLIEEEDVTSIREFRWWKEISVVLFVIALATTNLWIYYSTELDGMIITSNSYVNDLNECNENLSQAKDDLWDLKVENLLFGESYLEVINTKKASGEEIRKAMYGSE